MSGTWESLREYVLYCTYSVRQSADRDKILIFKEALSNINGKVKLVNMCGSKVRYILWVNDEGRFRKGLVTGGRNVEIFTLVSINSVGMY